MAGADSAHTPCLQSLMSLGQMSGLDRRIHQLRLCQKANNQQKNIGVAYAKLRDAAWYPPNPSCNHAITQS